MTEADFIEQIDCCFPYSSPFKWRRAVATALRISPNATFMVIHELCRPPMWDKESSAQRIAIWVHLSKRFRHPLAKKLSPIIDAQLSNNEVTVAKAIKGMQLVRNWPSQYNALSICYFACNDDKGIADRIFESIIDEWKNGSR